MRDPRWRRELVRQLGSRSDKRAAVETALREPACAQLSDRASARQCHVSHVTVARLRRALKLPATAPRIVRRGHCVYLLHSRTATAQPELAPSPGTGKRRSRPRPSDERKAAELLAYATALVPVHLPADIREEAAQAIAVDLLAEAITPQTLDRATVRRYVRAATGLRDPWRFRSIDAPVSNADGRSLGELFAA